MTTLTSLTSPITTHTVAFGATATLTHVEDARTAARVARHLRDRLGTLAASVVPGAETVLVSAAPCTDLGALLDAVNGALDNVPAAGAADARTISIPVRYDGADLSDVATLLGVSADEVVSRHTGPDYEVAFLGFAPGFPYLTGLDPFLAEVPRLDSPRTRVPAGSVGLAAGQTCIYPSVSPGGWRLLGSTDTVLFDPTNDTAPALLSPGDIVRFTVTR